MTLIEIIKLHNEKNKAFKRPKWHYAIYFEPLLGYYTTGYNCENCNILTIEDAIADDYILYDFD